MIDSPTTSRTQTAQDLLAAQRSNPAFREEWERLAPARAVAPRVVAYRIEHGLTQTALGRRLGMPPPAVARLESADHVPSIATLVRFSEAMEIESLLDIKPKRRRTSWVTREAHAATVVEQVTTANGSEVLVAAS